MEKYDVIVIGGGLSGVAAAIAAAREGCRVLIIEKGNAFGGAAVNSLVNPFMPNSTKVNGKIIEFSQGIFAFIWDKLKERQAMNELSFLEEELKFLLNEMLCKANVDILFHAYLFAVDKDGRKIKSITVATKSGVICFEADYFIDATGDAMVAYLSGYPTLTGREKDNLCQPMTLCFRLGNVDVHRFFASKPRLDMEYKKALERGELINPRENILVFLTPIDNVLHFNTTRVVKLDPTNAKDITKAEIIARRQVFEIYEFMKKHADGLENSFLSATASEIGVRESRKIIGEYVLTQDDCKNCVKFADAIAACNYDIDIHNPEGSGTSHYYFPEGEFYTIPYRSLIPKDADNLLVAGRCISSDHEAQASYRIMPTVCTIGEAAGTAISLAVKNKTIVKNINVKELQKRLKENGAFIGL
ncbi:MAG: FAD-dependent oxidoreductase [Clostridia bacterium]|nr:FAD-dependent oxidoreductase [Clostridia bacterium]